MIDLSDGLGSDLRHILKASRVGAELHSATIRSAERRDKRPSGCRFQAGNTRGATDGEDSSCSYGPRSGCGAA